MSHTHMPWLEGHPVIALLLCLLILAVALVAVWLIIACLIWLACQPVIFLLWLFTLTP